MVAIIATAQAHYTPHHLISAGLFIIALVEWHNAIYPKDGIGPALRWVFLFHDDEEALGRFVVPR